jgi:hypothetical protein
MFAKRWSVPKSLLATAGLVALALGGSPAEAAYVKTGVLTCEVGPGVGLIVTSTKQMTCTFSPNSGAAERYTGTIQKVGVDVGVTGAGVIVWAVLASVDGPPTRGVLAGTYGGASAEATLAVGAGANLLLGGSNRTFALQPLSVQGQIGLNFAVGITSLELTAT